MSIATVEVIGVGPVWVDSARDGNTVAFSLPSGCVLTRNGETVNDLSPIKHSGERAEYRIDCVSHDGKPVTATLSIT